MSDIFFRATDCRHCGNISSMSNLGSVTINHIYEDEDIGMSSDGMTYYTVLECPKCELKTIISYFWHDGMASEDEIELEILYPENYSFPLGLPTEILRAYKVARKIKSDDTTSYGLLLGRVLELVCIDKGATNGTLGNKIRTLIDRKIIPDNLVKVAEGLREYRNMSAHDAFGINDEDVPFVEALLTALLEYLYSAPAMAAIAEKKFVALQPKIKP